MNELRVDPNELPFNILEANAVLAKTVIQLLNRIIWRLRNPRLVYLPGLELSGSAVNDSKRKFNYVQRAIRISRQHELPALIILVGMRFPQRENSELPAKR